MNSGEIVGCECGMGVVRTGLLMNADEKRNGIKKMTQGRSEQLLSAGQSLPRRPNCPMGDQLHIDDFGLCLYLLESVQSSVARPRT